MRAHRLIPFFVLVIGASSAPLLQADNHQSLDFNLAAPAVATVQAGVKAQGFSPINSAIVDVGGATKTIAAHKAAEALCRAAALSGQGFCEGTAGAPLGCLGVTCCSAFVGTPGFPIQSGVACTQNPGLLGKGFLISLSQAGEEANVDQVNGGNIQNLTFTANFPGVGTDIASRGLIQIRPNGITGNIVLRVYHNQAGANPRTATVTVDASNNDPAEAQVLHNAIATALQNISPALSPAIVATVHTVQDANYPLTAFSYLKEASHFVELTNLHVVGISEVQVDSINGQTVTVEGTENQADAIGDHVVPTLSGWGAIFAAAILMLMIYWLHRKRMRMQQTV